MGKLKQRTYEILNTVKHGDIYSRIFDVFIVSLIFTNVLAVIFETVKAIYDKYQVIFYNFELFSVTIFTIEYILRLWSCTVNPEYSHPIKGRLKYAMSLMAMVDLLAILPFYLPMIVKVDLRFIRALRLFRLFRIFKLGRYSDSIHILGNVLKSRKEQLIITISGGMILLVVSSSLMYFVEHEAQPNVFSSIPAAMWWGVVTLATVGYGDIYPITIAGKLLAAVAAVLGIGMFALPAGIIGSGFSEEMEKRRSGKKTICPHCNREIS